MARLKEQLATEVELSPLPAGYVESAVLLPLWNQHLLLTQRSTSLPHHAGQISFPGGVLEQGEAPLEAALREAQEEVGLEPKSVVPLGFLPPVFSPRGFRVWPLVGWLSQEPVLRANPTEVAELFWVPLQELQEAPSWREFRLGRWIWHYPWRDKDIWGVTGAIVHELLERIPSVP